MELVCLDELVPNEHILKRVDKTVDFEFIREKTAHLYCQDNGRPAVDPVVLFKMIFIGYLFGIRNERQLVKEIQVNVAYRWFLGFDFTTKVPDASTISQNRRRRFSESTIYQDIFDEIVLFAMKKRLVDGKRLYTDSTHLKASANKNKFVLAEVQKSTRSYLDQLELDVAEDRAVHGKKPLKEKEREVELKEIKQSTTDPESGFMVRDGKPRGFFYLDHHTVDGKLALITDTHVTPANVHDSIPYLDRLDRQCERFGFTVESVGLDAGYNTAAICKGLEDRNIFGVVAHHSRIPAKGVWRNVSIVMMPMLTAIFAPITANCATRQPNAAATGYTSPTPPTAVFALYYPLAQQAPRSKKYSPATSGRGIGSGRVTIA